MISKLYFDKTNIIVKECRNKSVLDLGIVDHDVKYEQKKDWLHRKLKNVAKDILGLDLNEEAIKILKNKGYNVVSANAENFNLKNKFEVIVAGDLIEHLNNVGMFLNSVKKHMNKDSIFIATVPNCLSISNWLELIFFGRIKYINDEHTIWYDANTIKRVFENHGFIIKELSFMINNPQFIGETKFRRFLKNTRHFLSVIICSLRKQAAPTIFVKVVIK
ncbi:MAG: methyltransferase domain-containing protein [archaeon]|nr:methyltransferase domain-containing protein [archaeon]